MKSNWEKFSDRLLEKGLQDTTRGYGTKFYLPRGYTKFRILRDRPDDPQFWRVVGEHRVEKRSFVCLKKTFNERCPICDVIDVGRDRFASLFPSRRGIVNAVIEGVSVDGRAWGRPETGGRHVVLLYLPISVLNEIFLRIRMEPSDQRDLTHPTEGRSILVYRVGDGLDTKYVVNLDRIAPVSYYDQPEFTQELTDLSEFLTGLHVGYEDLLMDFQAYMTGSAIAGARAAIDSSTLLEPATTLPAPEPVMPSVPDVAVPSSESGDIEQYRHEIADALERLKKNGGNF